MKEEIVAKNAPAAIGPYSQGIAAGNLVFLSGQLPVNPGDGSMPDGVEAQVKRVFENISAILTTHGLGWENVVKTTVFLKNMDDFTVMNGIYGKYFTRPYPARSTVGVAKLPKDALVEIEVTAVR
ncbi:MAG: RidA family protein [Clostridiales bacterium]|jgi:2-iminobutanoate/2-iminopropanoate deaminase|nr:RidA family protein [Clostridiales bacterium]